MPRAAYEALARTMSELRVLIAEDDKVSRRVLEMHLKKWGYETWSACDGDDAARLLKEPDVPRLVVLDWMMPGRDGLSLCREIRARGDEPYTYVIILTAKGGKEDVVEGLDAGADDYITKPFDAQELRVRLRAGHRIIELQDELIRVREELRERATHDPLTGLLNRGAILDFLNRELSRCDRDGTPLSLVMVDIDHFKDINDAHGHPVGDVVLRDLSATMRGSVRRYDGVGRYGGEEFLLVLPGAQSTGASIQAERLRSRIESHPIETDSGVVAVTASVGVATWDASAPVSLDCLLKAADDALYRAKDGGRNRVETWAGAPIELGAALGSDASDSKTFRDSVRHS